MEKKILLKNILLELNQLPEVYLKHWFELIHTFCEWLPVQDEMPSAAKNEDFDWDALVDEVMDNRQQNNQKMIGSNKDLIKTTH